MIRMEYEITNNVH